MIALESGFLKGTWRRLGASAFVAAVGLFPLQSLSQVTASWTNRLSGPQLSGTIQPFKMLLNTESQLVIAGNISDGQGTSDYLLVNYDLEGALRWTTRQPGSPGTNSKVRGFVLDKAGNAFLTGSGGTCKFGSDGTVLWRAPVNGRGLAVDSEGNVGVTGFSDTVIITAKLHGGTGTNMWVRSYSGPYVDHSTHIASDAADGFFVVGWSLIHTNRLVADYENVLLHYDGGGLADKWTTLVSPVKIDRHEENWGMRDLRLDTDGNLYLLQDVGGNDGRRFVTQKFSPEKKLLWSFDSLSYEGTKYGITEGTTAGMVFGANGEVYLAGSQFYFAQDQFDNWDSYIVLKLSPAGRNLWRRYFASTMPRQHTLYGLALDSLENVYVTGASPGINRDNDFATVAFDKNGNRLWVQRFDGRAHGHDEAKGIVVGPDGSVYITGSSTTPEGGRELVTIKYQTFKPKLNLQPNGKALVEFPVNPSQAYHIEATTDFRDWQDLGEVLADGMGWLRFEDSNAPAYDSRFYRTKQ